jgi:hypothetical protein
LAPAWCCRTGLPAYLAWRVGTTTLCRTMNLATAYAVISSYSICDFFHGFSHCVFRESIVLTVFMYLLFSLHCFLSCPDNLDRQHMHPTPGVTKRCRLSWPIEPSYMSPNAGGGGGGVAKSQLMSTAVDAQINFGDLSNFNL